MTKTEISNMFDLPVSTLNDWEKKSSRKNKLYHFLRTLDKESIEKQNRQKREHRIFHILNKNIPKEEQYTFDEIREAFLKDDYSKATMRERIVYAKFFKECDVDDLKSFEETFHASKRQIKKIYQQIPERSLRGVAQVWDRRFRLKHLLGNWGQTEQHTLPPALQKVLSRRHNV